MEETAIHDILTDTDAKRLGNIAPGNDNFVPLVPTLQDIAQRLPADRMVARSETNGTDDDEEDDIPYYAPASNADEDDEDDFDIDKEREQQAGIRAVLHRELGQSYRPKPFHW